MHFSTVLATLVALSATAFAAPAAEPAPVAAISNNPRTDITDALLAKRDGSCNGDLCKVDSDCPADHPYCVCAYVYSSTNPPYTEYFYLCCTDPKQSSCAG